MGITAIGGATRVRPGPGVSAKFPVYPSTRSQLDSVIEAVADGERQEWTEPAAVARTFLETQLNWETDQIQLGPPIDRGDGTVEFVATNPMVDQAIGSPVHQSVIVQPWPGDIYVVQQAETDAVILEHPAPDDPLASNGTFTFVGSKAFPTVDTVRAEFDWEGGAVNGIDFRRAEDPFRVDSEVFGLSLAQQQGHAPRLGVVGRLFAEVCLLRCHDRTAEVLNVGLVSYRLVPEPATDESASPGPDDLPLQVQETRSRLLDAAGQGDWDALRRLIPDEGFTFSFGGQRDPIAFWQGFEGEGATILDVLSRLLERTDHGRTRRIYIWPSAAAEVPADWNQRDVDELREIYSMRQIEEFQELDLYLGWRVGIDQDGTWVFFVQGD